jgi:hypothetical protein
METKTPNTMLILYALLSARGYHELEWLAERIKSGNKELPKHKLLLDIETALAEIGAGDLDDTLPAIYNVAEYVAKFQK